MEKKDVIESQDNLRKILSEEQKKEQEEYHAVAEEVRLEHKGIWDIRKE